MSSAMTGVPSGVPGSQTVLPSMIREEFSSLFRNQVLNGRFDLWQRATSFSTPASAAYTADMWAVYYDGTIGTFTLSQQAFTYGQTDVPYEPEFFLRWAHSSAGSGSSYRRIENRIENARNFASKTAYLTFYAKADSARNVTPALVQNFGSGGSADVVTSGSAVGLTTSWQKFTVPFSVPSISGKTIGAGNFLGIRFSLPINTTMTIDFADVQLEPYQTTPRDLRPVAVEWSMCQRYCQTVDMFVPTAAAPAPLPFKSAMRTTPTVSGGGAGFATSPLTRYGGSCSQTAGANQTLLLEANL